MLTIQELRALAGRLSLQDFVRQMGPFGLIQRPPQPVLAQHAMALASQKTTQAQRAGAGDAGLSLILQFDDLAVATLPPVGAAVEQFSVGRQPDSDLVLDDPSVSKRHATLLWDTSARQARVRDLGSTNGTYVNEDEIGQVEAPLFDGTVLSFGDVDFWFLLSTTLHEKLVRGTRTGGRVLV